jgi:hypothetical protein
MQDTSSKLLITSTDNVSLAILHKAFNTSSWSQEAEISNSQRILLSAQPPSFVHLIAELSWWKQLGFYVAGTVATGALGKAGSDFWDNKAKITKVVTDRLWSLADRVVNLQSMLDGHTQVFLAFPNPDIYFPASLKVDSLDVNVVAWQIAALTYHAADIEKFIATGSFDPLASAEITINDRGDIHLKWMDKTEMDIREHNFIA